MCAIDIKTVTIQTSQHMSYQIPLDTLGHPLPPPVPSNTICRIPRSKWRKWWIQYYTNTLPEDRDCCSCGVTFEMNELTALNAKLLVDGGVQRQYLNNMGLANIFLCKGCRKKCEKCTRFIPDAQKKQFLGLCQECYLLSRGTLKRKTPDTTAAENKGSQKARKTANK